MLGIKSRLFLFLLIFSVSEIQCQKVVVNAAVYNKNCEVFCEAVKIENNTKWKKCANSSDCETKEEYCELGSEPLGNGKLKFLNEKFCFPTIPLYYEKTLMRCTIDDDCSADGNYCDQNVEKKVAFCATPIKSCKNGPSLTKRPCLDDWDCQKTHKNSKCLEIDDGRKTCCINPEELAKSNCSSGFPTYPFQYCDSSSNPCAYAGESSLKKWCDFDSKICCETENHYYDDLKGKTEMIYCPDHRTVLSAQPGCGNGEDCEIGGNCWKGRCCPDCEVNKLDIKMKFEDLPDKSFMTESPCKFEQESTRLWWWTYCDQKQLKIVQLGKLNIFGEPIELGNSTNCKKSTDCDTIYQENMVCISAGEHKSYCVIMPTLENVNALNVTHFRSAQHRMSVYIQYVVYIGLVGCCILVVVCIADWCYRKSRRRLRV
ncbi:unnamed protein product [Caenorhabditis angaria]|uniref:Domain of unknown function DX domain-containing protein n=1 Tax=Caenorhabditis angaria TaxID=860376 RepID=A0A9P1J223_9PELO|nr:unnamed protein product [Caenorhabditis angaria]